MEGPAAPEHEEQATLGAVGRAANRLLPSEVVASPEEARRGRLLLPVMTFLTLAAFFFAFETRASTRMWGGAPLVLLGGGILSLFNWPILWWQRNVRAPGLIVSLETVLVVGACGAVGGGVSDPSQVFLLVAPVVAGFIVGPLAGYAIAALSVAVTLALFFAPSFGVRMQVVDPETNPYFFATGTTSVVLILASITYLYEESRRANLARLERALAAVRDKNSELHAIHAELVQRRDRAEADSRRKDAFLREMRSFSVSQSQGLDRTRQAIAQLADTIRSIAVSADTVASSASASDGRLANVRGSANTVQKTAEELLSSVDDTSAALLQLSDAVHEMQRQFVALSRSAETTTSAMGAMEESAARVEQGAARTASLAGAVIEDAARGSEAMRRAQSGVDEIRAASRAVDEAIHALGARVKQISRMNALIEEIAVETNVLALNASIIAAQAGANGLGFSVVAEQIKALAARTAQSTREIAQVITAVEHETGRAMSAIERGAQAVDAGTELSVDAQRALEQIVTSATASTTQVKDIELATIEQARRARTVAEAMGGVAQKLGGVSQAVDEHKRASAQIEAALERLRRLAPALEAQSREQVDAVEDARRTIARVTGLANELSAVQGAQTRASEQAVHAVEEIQRAQRGATDALATLGS